MSALATALYERAKNIACVRCGRMHVRLGEDFEGRLCVDVLCHGCFERAPTMFKITGAQDAYRNAIKNGCHPRIAQRLAEVFGGFKWRTT